ncbi:hypothetical protein Tco_0574940 [Tanacetum coccineum]
MSGHNEDYLKINVLMTNTPYPSRKIRRIHQGRYGVSVPILHQRPRRKQESICRIQENQYVVFKLYGNKIFWKISNVVPTPRNPQYAKEMADKEMKSTMREFATNGQADYYSGITSITVNGKNAYELKGKFLDDLNKNAFSSTNGEDAVEHIEYFLRIVDPINLPNVNHDKLRVVFPISLAGD